MLARDIVMYGADFFRDQSANTDSSQTTVIGFGPPHPSSKTRTQVPNASLQSLGLFLQNDLRLHDQLSVILGGRFQHVRSEPNATAGRTTCSTATPSPPAYMRRTRSGGRRRR